MEHRAVMRRGDKTVELQNAGQTGKEQASERWSHIVASSPGHSQFFNVTHRKTLKNWEWPGDDASHIAVEEEGIGGAHPNIEVLDWLICTIKVLDMVKNCLLHASKHLSLATSTINCVFISTTPIYHT